MISPEAEDEPDDTEDGDEREAAERVLVAGEASTGLGSDGSSAAARQLMTNTSPQESVTPSVIVYHWPQ